MTDHLFVFYFARLSVITQPVALAAYAGAGLAKCDPMTTAVEACELGFAGCALIGTIVLSMAFQGWLLWRLGLIERIIFLAAGMLMFIPGTMTGIAVAGLFFW